MIEYQGARIQLLDLPGIVEGASQGERNTLFFYFTFLLVPKDGVEVDRWLQVSNDS